MPKLIPSICGTVRRKPKFAPLASSIMLFGPGVTEVTKAKPKGEEQFPCHGAILAPLWR